MSNIEGWEIVFTGPRFAAEVVLASLEANGIRAEMMTDSAYGPALDLSDSRVYVPDALFSAAQELVRGEFPSPS